MSEQVLEKATAYITRSHDDETNLLLFRHPTAGIQVPAGTVEPFEDPLDAAVREAFEETGRSEFTDVTQVGSADEPMPEDDRVIVESTPVYVSPDSDISRGHLGRGCQLQVISQSHNRIQVSQKEWDRHPDPETLMFHLLGWVPRHCLTSLKHRTFVHIRCEDEEAAGSWRHEADGHTFECFWALLTNLPTIIPPQARWLNYVVDDLGYEF